MIKAIINHQDVHTMAALHRDLVLHKDMANRRLFSSNMLLKATTNTLKMGMDMRVTMMAMRRITMAMEAIMI